MSIFDLLALYCISFHALEVVHEAMDTILSEFSKDPLGIWFKL